MILTEYKQFKLSGFYYLPFFKFVGLQNEDGKFRNFNNFDFYFDIHQIERQASFVVTTKDACLLLRFQDKQYKAIHDTF